MGAGGLGFHSCRRAHDCSAWKWCDCSSQDHWRSKLGRDGTWAGEAASTRQFFSASQPLSCPVLSASEPLAPRRLAGASQRAGRRWEPSVSSGADDSNERQHQLACPCQRLKHTSGRAGGPRSDGLAWWQRGAAWRRPSRRPSSGAVAQHSQPQRRRSPARLLAAHRPPPAAVSNPAASSGLHAAHQGSCSPAPVLGGGAADGCSRSS